MVVKASPLGPHKENTKRSFYTHVYACDRFKKRERIDRLIQKIKPSTYTTCKSVGRETFEKSQSE